MERMIVLERLKRRGERNFQIEWFGNVVNLRMPNGNVRCVRTVCREIHSSGQTSLLPETVIVNVPLAFLGQVRLGDIWGEGSQVGTVDLQEETFSSLQVDGQTMTSIEAGARRSASTPSHELPFQQFDGHREHTQSLLTRIAIDENRSLLIPCMEVLRFYFGSSGVLLNKLFDGFFGLNEILKLAQGDMTGPCEVQLVNGITGLAAPDIARIAMDQWAHHAVKMLTMSGMRATVNCESHYPRILLPLNGKTDLTVRGRWIEHGDQRTFLALQIVRCTHPFPFTELAYHVWTKEKPQQNQSDVSCLHKMQPASLLQKSGENVARLSASQLKRLAFPDLVRKRISAVWHRV